MLFMKKQTKEFYSNKISEGQKSIDILKKKSFRYSVLRLLCFIALVALIIAGFSEDAYYFWFLVVALPLFLSLLKLHDNLLKKLAFLNALAKVYRKEADYLKFKFPEQGQGFEYNDPKHSYARDLLLFGEHSLFHYVNRSLFHRPASLLAGYLKQSLFNASDILKRQKAVQELSGKEGFNHRFLAFSYIDQSEPSYKQVQEWLQLPPFFLKTAFMLPVLLIPIGNLLLIAALFFGFMPLEWYFSWLILPLSLSGFYAFKINKRHNKLSAFLPLIDRYIKQFELIGEAQFSADILQEIHRQISGNEVIQRVKQLKAIMNALDNRLNLFAWPVLNALFVWDIKQTRRLEKWIRDNGSNLESWLHNADQMEALISLGNFAFNHPEFAFPEPCEDVVFVAEKMGHPLISEENRVCNPLILNKIHQFYVVTGANMAGKTTYLRTAGINLVLAGAGAPVCADKMRYRPLKIYTSISTEDSLKDSESYFFAEVRRLKEIIDQLAQGEQLFLILDEILKGTNSIDKREGSKALLLQLLRQNAVGLIATHDLELSALSKQKPDNIIPKRFEVEILNSRMIFDYLIKDGTAQTLNALHLMREMGIMV